MSWIYESFACPLGLYFVFLVHCSLLLTLAATLDTKTTNSSGSLLSLWSEAAWNQTGSFPWSKISTPPAPVTQSSSYRGSSFAISSMYITEQRHGIAYTKKTKITAVMDKEFAQVDSLHFAVTCILQERCIYVHTEAQSDNMLPAIF